MNRFSFIANAPDSTAAARLMRASRSTWFEHTTGTPTSRIGDIYAAIFQFSASDHTGFGFPVIEVKR
jgi:hypothetical protein